MKIMAIFGMIALVLTSFGLQHLTNWMIRLSSENAGNKKPAIATAVASFVLSAILIWVAITNSVEIF